MRLHWFQHVPYEDLGAIADWAQRRGHSLSSTRWQDPHPLPPTPELYDALILMGGPMGVYEEHLIPWLKVEKQALQQALAAGRPVLGVCLGAQLLAEALGARVYPHDQKELGWFPVSRHPAAAADSLLSLFPETFTPFHWHGDTFHLPADATPLGASAACPHQGFSHSGRHLALQFHIELREDALQRIVREDRLPAWSGPHVQTPDEFLPPAAVRTSALQPLLHSLLDRWASPA